MKNIDEAAQWFTRLRDGELAESERKEFADWLSEAPLNVREYLGTAKIWGALRTPNIWPRESQEDLLEVIRRAKDANVFALNANGDKAEDLVPPGPPVAAAKRRRRLLPFALVASAAFVALFVWYRVDSGTTVYRTARGEQRSIVLTDGSIVQLNTLSRLIVHFNQGQRRVELPQGEAFFRVAHDKTRPFEVRTKFAFVRAVGTEFDVYSRKGDTQVAVVEGRVIVGASPSQKDSSPAPVERSGRQHSSATGPIYRSQIGVGIPLAAGQQITVSPDAVPNPIPASPAIATAWIQRRIVLDNDEVATAVAEFNRYNKMQMQVRDADLSRFRISGVFDADDPRALVNYLEAVQGIHVDEIDGELLLQR